MLQRSLVASYKGSPAHRWLPAGKGSRNRKSEAAIANIDPSDVCDLSVHVVDLDLVTRLDVIYIREVKNSLAGGTLDLSVERLTDRLFFLLPSVLYLPLWSIGVRDRQEGLTVKPRAEPS